ncbi:MAG TPA: YbjN domain-containing protein, partial [Aggregatilineales bacterium]|nr:YbjN domain-containing protein [Aggregatilineales bacterium]
MNHLTVEQVEEFFDQYGWTYSRESKDTWITGVRTRVSAFRIMVRVTEHWVFFIINPLVVAPPRPADRLRVYYHALRYNLDMNFAKLGIDSDGDIFMAIEMPTENFEYSHFVDALDGLSHHASMIYAELFGLAHSPERSDGRYDDELKHHTISYFSRWGPTSFEEDDMDSELLADIISGEYD